MRQAERRCARDQSCERGWPEKKQTVKSPQSKAGRATKAGGVTKAGRVAKAGRVTQAGRVRFSVPLGAWRELEACFKWDGEPGSDMTGLQFKGTILALCGGQMLERDMM